jgi:hypothetical protein
MVQNGNTSPLRDAGKLNSEDLKNSLWNSGDCETTQTLAQIHTHTHDNIRTIHTHGFSTVDM